MCLPSFFQPMTMLFGPMRSETSSRLRVAVKVRRLRHAALGGHEVDLGVAVVLAGEGEPLAVGREAGEHLEAVVAGQPAGDAAGGRHGVQVAGVGEDDLVAVDGGEAQAARFIRGSRGMASENHDETECCRKPTSLHDRFLSVCM